MFAAATAPGPGEQVTTRLPSRAGPPTAGIVRAFTRRSSARAGAGTAGRANGSRFLAPHGAERRRSGQARITDRRCAMAEEMTEHADATQSRRRLMAGAALGLAAFAAAD